MYHEEKMIDGVLQWRGTPDGEFEPYTLAQLSARVEDLKSYGEACKRRMKEAAALLLFEDVTHTGG